MRRRTNRTKRGLLLVDTLTAIFILSIAALALFSTIPVAGHASKIASDQGKATYIATKYIEQLQTLKTSDLSTSNLTTLNLIDTGQNSAPYSFANVPLDNGSYYSPSKMLKGAEATVNFTSIDAGSVRADIVVKW